MLYRENCMYKHWGNSFAFLETLVIHENVSDTEDGGQRQDSTLGCHLHSKNVEGLYRSQMV